MVGERMEGGGMVQRSKQAYVRTVSQRDQQATRAEKRARLDECTKVCGSHRQYALGLLNRPGPPGPRPRRVPGTRRHRWLDRDEGQWAGRGG